MKYTAKKNGRKKLTVSVYMYEGLVKRLAKIANRERRSMSDMIVLLVEKALLKVRA